MKARVAFSASIVLCMTACSGQAVQDTTPGSSIPDGSDVADVGPDRADANADTAEVEPDGTEANADTTEVEPDVVEAGEADVPQCYAPTYSCSCSCGATTTSIAFDDCEKLQDYTCNQETGEKYSNCVATSWKCAEQHCPGNTLSICGCRCGELLLVDGADGSCVFMTGDTCNYEKGLKYTDCEHHGTVCPMI